MKRMFFNCLAQQSWIRALDSKFKICSKKLTNFRICYKALTKPLALFFLIVMVFFGWTGCKNNIDEQLPSGSMINHSECKASTNMTSANPALFSIPKEMECLEYNYDGESSLIIKHLNTVFNCCPDSFVTNVVINENIITIQEDDAKHGCDCDCLYDLEYKIENLPAGIYTIRINNTHISGIQPLECTVDLRTALSNICCVTRGRYPWI